MSAKVWELWKWNTKSDFQANHHKCKWRRRTVRNSSGWWNQMLFPPIETNPCGQYLLNYPQQVRVQSRHYGQNKDKSDTVSVLRTQAFSLSDMYTFYLFPISGRWQRTTDPILFTPLPHLRSQNWRQNGSFSNWKQHSKRREFWRRPFKPFQKVNTERFIYCVIGGRLGILKIHFFIPLSSLSLQ